MKRRVLYRVATFKGNKATCIPSVPTLGYTQWSQQKCLSRKISRRNAFFARLFHGVSIERYTASFNQGVSVFFLTNSMDWLGYCPCICPLFQPQYMRSIASACGFIQCTACVRTTASLKERTCLSFQRAFLTSRVHGNKNSTMEMSSDASSFCSASDVCCHATAFPFLCFPVPHAGSLFLSLYLFPYHHHAVRRGKLGIKSKHIVCQSVQILTVLPSEHGV